MKLTEFELIKLITKKIPERLKEPARLHDDTAVFVSPQKAGLYELMTTDCLVEGVDFLFKTAKPEEVGQKAIAVNLSDVAAMGGTPKRFTIALGLPQYLNERWIQRFYDGIMFWAKRYNVLCAGGDLTQAPCFFSNITLIGERNGRPPLRSGAKPGEWIGVTGGIGGSISKHHLIFKPRVEEGRFLADKGVSSMIDVSDGLIQDLGHILDQSRVGCDLDLDCVPLTQEAQKNNRFHLKKQKLAAVTDGEDFELLFTASDRVRKVLEREWPARFRQIKLSWIGRIHSDVESAKVNCGGQLLDLKKIKKKGFQHFL